MKIFVWRHNRKYHSWSMIDEPCVNDSAYTDAVAIVMAETLEDALHLLKARNEGWFVEDLKKFTPRVYDADKAGIIFTDIRGE